MQDICDRSVFGGFSPILSLFSQETGVWPAKSDWFRPALSTHGIAFWDLGQAARPSVRPSGRMRAAPSTSIASPALPGYGSSSEARVCEPRSLAGHDHRPLRGVGFDPPARGPRFARQAGSVRLRGLGGEPGRADPAPPPRRRVRPSKHRAKPRPSAVPRERRFRRPGAARPSSVSNNLLRRPAGRRAGRGSSPAVGWPGSTRWTSRPAPFPLQKKIIQTTEIHALIKHQEFRPKKGLERRARESMFRPPWFSWAAEQLRAVR
jgi:hypothetical protein